MTEERKTLRDAVARALCDTEWGDGIWDKPGLLSQMERNAYNGLATAAIAVALERAANIVDRNAEACTGNIMLRDILAGNAAAIRALTEKEETP